MEDKDYGMMLQQMTEDQRRQQKHIDALTAQMKPLAETSNGQFALQDMLADKSAPKEQRAAAAQALAPGFVASIGKYGELSFSAAPMADMGQPAGQSFEQGRMQDKVTAGKQSTFMSNFDTVYTDIMNEKDPLKIAEKAGTLSAELANVVNSKEAGVRSRLAQSLGINQLESQIAASSNYDRQLYAQNGLQYMGPTEETWQLINQRDQMTARMEQLVGDELSKDPELANIRTRMGALDTLIKQKQSIFGQSMAGAQDAAAVTINPDRVDSARRALGAPDTPEAAAEIRKNIMGNNPQYLEAERLGQAALTDLLATSEIPGQQGSMASNVLKSRGLSDADIADIQKEMKELKATLPAKDEKGEWSLPATAKTTMGAKELAQAQMQLNARYAQRAIENRAIRRADAINNMPSKLGQPDGWDMPTDPLLAEIPAIVQDIKASDPKAPITTDTIINRMTWDTDEKDAKIKALSNYMYAQSKKDTMASVFGAVPGYTSADEVRLGVQAKVIANSSNAVLNSLAVFTGLGAIKTGVIGTYDNLSKIGQATTPALLYKAYKSFEEKAQ